MKTIKNDITNELVIKNSRFITFITKINSYDDIEKKINDIKKLYKDATHYCYAYIIDRVNKAYDDGEPSGTAGKPILTVLEKNELNYILAIVIRYFGGIKLGAGGLIRAYNKSISQTLVKADFVKLIEGYKILIEFNYTDSKEIDFLLKDIQIIRKNYDDKITYELFTDINNFNKIFNMNCKITILNKEKATFLDT
ncbi:MAG: YigZ family protein [Bacilli bacterium]|nr:YigZ family protein [Bacilli bacterium]